MNVIWNRNTLIGLLFAAIWFSGVEAQTVSAPMTNQPHGSEQANNVQMGNLNSAVNAITQTAVSVGILSCAGRVNQVTNFLSSSGQDIGTFIFGPPAQPDQNIFSISMEVPAGEIPVAYASATFAPNQGNGCGSLYETVVYWPITCDLVAQKQFFGMKPIRTVRQQIVVLGGNSPARVFLMPAGSGCVAIKKEIVR